MKAMLFTVMPMFVCMFWALVTACDLMQGQRKRHKIALLTFMMATTLLYFGHCVFFNRVEHIIPLTDTLYCMSNLAVYPLYYIYICMLTHRQEHLWENLLWLLPAIGAGIGLFIAFLGMENSGIIVNNETTLVCLGNVTQGTALLAMAGLFITAGMVMAKVRGGMLWGILITTLLGLFIKDPATGQAITQVNGIVSAPVSVAPIFCKFQWNQIFCPDMIVVVVTLLFMDMFDTMGTLIGVNQTTKISTQDNMYDDIPNLDKMFMADSIATVAGACLGTSTTTTYVESASGVMEGGRTGLTAFFTAVCFALALFFCPVFLAIPSAATAPALIIVGVMMMPAVARIHWDDYCKAIPAFLTLITIPLAYSISDGILIGVISYVLCHAVAGKFKEISVTMWVLAILFICKYLFL